MSCACGLTFVRPPQDQKRAEKVSKRVNAIQEVKESVTLLTQLLQDYDSTATSQSNAELLQVSWKTDAFNKSVSELEPTVSERASRLFF